MKNYLPLLITFLAATATAQNDEPLTWDLRKCLQYALDNNIAVKQAALTKNSSEVILHQSKYERFPELYAGASQNLTNGSSIDPITSDYVSEQIYSSSFNLSTQLTLYSGGQLLRQIDQNKLLVEQQDLFVKEAKNNISLSIVAAYLQALYVRESIGMARNNLAISTRQLEQTQTRFELGDLASRDVAEVESQHTTNQFNLVQAENAYTRQVLTLKQLLELKPGSPFAIDTVTTLPPPGLSLPSLEEVYRTALAIMPQVKASELGVDIGHLGLDLAKTGYKPSVFLNARLYTGHTTTQDMDYFKQLDGNFNQQVGLSVNVPIFDKKQTYAQVQHALIDIERARLNQVAVTNELYRNIETAWQNATAALSEEKAAKVVRDAARTSFDMARRQFELGILSATDLLVSQNTYINAEQQHLQAKYSGLLYYSLLLFYMGREISL